jgi:hypothetical protein
MISKAAFTLSLLIVAGSAHSQTFRTVEKYLLDPTLFIKENYESISINEEGYATMFNHNNSNSYLLVITNDRGLSGHILYQIGESGKINFLAISSNLKSLLACSSFAKMKFDLCVKRISQDPFESDFNSGCLECLMQRMNACN